MARDCSLNKDALKSLRRKVYGDIMDKINNKEDINLKSYMKSVYDMVYSKNENQVQALDVVSMIPHFTFQLAGVDTNFRKGVGQEKMIEAMSLIDEFSEENGLNSVKEYLGIQDQTVSKKLETLDGKKGQLSLEFGNEKKLETPEEAEARNSRSPYSQITGKRIVALRLEKDQPTGFGSYKGIEETEDGFVGYYYPDNGQTYKIELEVEGKTIEEVRDKINAKYNIEVQKVDINIKRKEALDKLFAESKNPYGPTDNQINSLNATYDKEIAALEGVETPEEAEARNSRGEEVVEATAEVPTDVVEAPVYAVDSSNDIAHLLEGSIMQDVNNHEDQRSRKYSQELIEIGEALDNDLLTAKMGDLRAIIDGRLVVDFITSDGRRFFMYRSTGTGTTADTEGLWAPIMGFAKNGWFIKHRDSNGMDPKKSKYGIQTFKAMETYLIKNETDLFTPTENQTENQTEEKKEEVKKVVEETTPQPIEKQNVSTKSPTYLSTLSDKLKKSILDLWSAVVPNFLSTTGIEADYQDKQDPKYRVPHAESKFEYGVQRNLVKMFYADPSISSSEELNLPGVTSGGVYLKAVRASKSETKKSGAQEDENAVVLQVTDQFGEPIKFTSDFQPTLSEGNIAEYFMRNTSDKKKLSKTKIDQMASSLARQKKGGYVAKNSPEFLEARAEIVTQIDLIDTVRKHLAANPTDNLMFAFDGGSMGHITTSTIALTKISAVNESLEFETMKTNDARMGTEKGLTYATSEGLYGQQIRIEQPGVSESSDIDLIKQLLFEDLISESGGPISVVERQNILQNYIEVKGEKEYRPGEPRITIMPNTDNTKGYTVLMTVPSENGTTLKEFDLSNPKQKQEAEQNFQELVELTKTFGNYNDFQKNLATGNESLTMAVDKASAKANQIFPDIPLPTKSAAEMTKAEKQQEAQNKKKRRYSQKGFSFKSNLNAESINSSSGQVPTATISKNSNGDLVLSKVNVPVQTFLASQGFKIGTPELSADGKLRRTNSYLTFRITDLASDKLTGKSIAEQMVKEEEVKQRDDSVNEDAKAQGHDSESKPGDSKIDRFNDMFDQDTDELNRSLDQAKMTKKQIQQKIDEAREWYEKSPLNKYFPFEVMFDKINKKGVAQWTMAGITLFEGSDYTDLYHEAWHGFSQGFLTLEQKVELYNELKRKRGTFTDYNGKQVSFKDASDKQIEEYLAEEFRSYMLRGGKEGTKKLTKKTKTFFEKILRALEYLFTDSSHSDVYINPKSNAKVNKLFENLRLGNLSSYSFSYDNAMFGKLNAGITALEDVKGVNQLNYQDSMDINEMIDYYISDYAILRSSTKLEREKLADIESELRRTDLSQKERANLLAEKEGLRNNTQYLGAITQSQTEMARAYKWAKSELTVLKDDINKKYLAETNSAEQARLFKQKQTLEFAIEHFGNTDNLNLNIADKDSDIIKGVIGYHMSKTALFQSDTLMDRDNISEDEKYANQLYSQSGNEMSLIEMAKPEIIFLLKSLPDVSKGVEAKNKYGVTKLAAFNATWNRLARALQNTHNIDDMYVKLNELAQEYEPIKHLIRRLGDPMSATLTSEVNLQSTFFQTFAKTRVPLVQTTIVRDKNGNWNANIGEAFNSDYAVGRKWQNDLSTAIPNTNPYILTDDKGNNYVNVKKLLNDFSESDAKNNRIEFYNALGFTLTDTKEIRKEIQQRQYDPTYFHKALVKLNSKNENLYDFREITDDERPKYKALMNLEAKYSDVFSNFAVTNAEGNMQFEHTLNNSMTIMINSINNATDYESLVSQPHMEHLRIDGPNANPFAQASVWMKSLFDLNGTKETNPNWGQPVINKQTGERVNLKLVNLSGVLVQESKDEDGDGIASASADKVTKILMDLHLAQAGGFELVRHADKGTSYAVKIDGPINGNTNSTDSYVPLSAFVETAAYQNVTYERVLPHLIAELKRMREMKKLAKRVETGETLAYDYFYIKEGQEFHAFDNVLKNSTGIKTTLKDIAFSTEDIETTIRNNTDLQAEIKRNLNEYFDLQYQDMVTRTADVDFYAENLVKRIGERNPLLKGREKEVILRSFVHNNWIHNIESVALLYGDLAQYKHAKEEFHKRNAGIGSTGTIYRTDKAMQNFINNNLWESSLAKKLGLEQRPYTGQFNTGIFEDQNVISVYAKEYAKADQLGPEGAAGYGTEKKGKIKGQNEADAQGLIAFDSYRQLKVSEGTWSNAQEKLYKDIVNGKEVKPQDVVKFFPVIKAQYWGPLAQQTSIPLTAFHKYSLMPLIPGMIKDTNAEILHNKMMKEGIDYITFESGSKVSNVTKTGNVKDGTRDFDKAYVSSQSRILVDELKQDQLNDKGEYIPYFTKNTIHLEYLKNQLRIHEEPKGNVIFSTQLRKLVEDGLMKNGVPIDYKGTKKEWDSIKTETAKKKVSKYYTMLRTYEKNLDKMTQIAKDDLLAEMNWESKIVNGQEVLNGDIKSLLSFVQKELTRQDLAQHEIDFIQFDENGKLKHDLSKHTSVERIEKLLNALMVKKLIRQKVNGEGLIQVAPTFFEKVADQENRNFTNPTPEDLLKYGTDDLPFYQKGKGPNGTTSAMKVKVALQGNFEHLLKLKDKEGNIVRTREKLNTLIKDEEWLNTGRNREMITMVAVRIPVQGLNSMEFMEVYEFLDPSAGSIIIPSSEIVTKSGSDYDVDKMTVMMPNIRKAKYKKGQFGISEQVGEPQMWNWTEEELKEAYDQYLEAQQAKLTQGEDIDVDNLLSDIFGLSEGELDQMVIDEINDMIRTGEVMDFATFKKKRLGKKAVENDLISNIRDILSLDTNFKPLLTPNSTELLTEKQPGEKQALTEKFQDSARDFNSKDRLYGEARGGQISATRTLEYGYNLYKHQSNNIGKQTLGLGAVDNTYNTLFNRIGAYMNHTTVAEDVYNAAQTLLAKGKSIKDSKKRDKWESENKDAIKQAKKIIAKREVQTILLDHNTMTKDGKSVISLSHLKSKGTDTNISDVINQMINGWLDIAKDAWIFDIQGNKEVAPTLLFMIQAGVPLQDAVTLVSSPMVKEYIEKQQLYKSTFANPLGMDIASPDRYRTEARKHILTTAKYGINLQTNKFGGLSNAQIKEATEKSLTGVKKLDTDKLFKNTNKHSTAKKSRQNYTYTEQDKQAFLHYLQLENMGKSVRDVKMRTNVDTSKDESLFAAQDRLGMLQALREDGRLPSSIVDGIIEESPISSFFIQGFQINLLGRLFPLRNHKVINQYVRENIDKPLQDATFGDKEITVTNWKSDLISFILQNELKHFDQTNLKSYKGYQVASEKDIEPAALQYGAFVKDGKLYVDKNSIVSQYDNKTYQKSTYWNDLGLSVINKKGYLGGLDPFRDSNEYMHFVLERETLRSLFSIEQASETIAFKNNLKEVKAVMKQPEDMSTPLFEKKLYKYAYELFLRNKALTNTFNHTHLFKSSKSSYAGQFKEIREAYPELAKRFDLMNALSVTDKGGTRNLMLNDAKLTGDQKNILNENLEMLSDVNELKTVLPNTTLEQRLEIADYFKLMPLVAFMQSGMNVKSKFAITQFVSQDLMLNVLNKPTKQILERLDKVNDTNTSDPALDQYLHMYTSLFETLNASKHRNQRVRGKNYFRNISLDNLETSLKQEKIDPRIVEDFEYTDEVGTTQPQVGGTINIYAGTNENAELSNFAERPYTNGLGVEFRNVEAAFQYAKTNWAGGESNADNDSIRMKLQTATGAQAKALGRKIKGLDTKAWDQNSESIMKNIIKESFEQNPQALAKLLGTGNATLTHTQDKGKWGKLFPKILMEVRSELAGTQPQTGKVEIKTGVTDIFVNNKELQEIGTEQQYSQYLNSVFPNSKLKDVVYKGIADTRQNEGAANLGKGSYWALGKDKAEGYAGQEGTVVAAVVNLEDPLIVNITKNDQRGYTYPGDVTTREATINAENPSGRDSMINYEYLDKEDYQPYNKYTGAYTGALNADGTPVQNQFKQQPYATELAVQSSEQVHELGSEADIAGFKEFVKTSSLPTDTSQVSTEAKTEGNYSVRTYDENSIVGPKSASKIKLAPDTSYVYDGPVVNQGGPRTGSQFIHNVDEPNKVGLPTKMMYSQQTKGTEVRADIIRDIDGKIDPQVKDAIDTAVNNIKEHIKQGQEIAFTAQGYGLEMLDTNKQGNQYAPKTFLYLSEQLYSNFGYINPGYLANHANNETVKASYAQIQGNQNITDVEIQEVSDKEVEEFMKNCI